VTIRAMKLSVTELMLSAISCKILILVLCWCPFGFMETNMLVWSTDVLF